MAKLTLSWPVGRYRREVIPAKPGGTLAQSQDYEGFVREGAAIEKPAHDCDVLYEHLVRRSPDDFVNTYGLLWTRGRRESVDYFVRRQHAVAELLTAKKTDDWDAAKIWFEYNPEAVRLVAVLGEDEAGRPQLEFQPRNLLGFIVAQLIQDWTSGATYKWCKRPACPEWFYYGPGTAHRETAQYCSQTCKAAHFYERKKGKSK
jgi:hypothetical protein